MVSAGWWLGTPPQQRQNLVAGRMLALPDGTWWLFGAWGRWYRWTPADGQWHLCPPPRLTITRMSARPLQQGVPVPQVPPHVVPAGPDLAYEPPPALAFVDAGVRPEITSRVRATVEAAAALPTPDYPHWWGLFSSAVPSTVPLTWGVMLWCATAPVFDARIDAQMLGLWSSYRSRPLPEVDGPRWLTPPPLESLVGLYAERLRSGRVDSAVVILRTMWAMASALREDSRFQQRADALITMLGATLQNPTIDYGALAYGDQAVVQQWLTRCPPALAPALRLEASAGEHFRNAYYDLAVALTPVAGGPAERGYVEPRLIAAALLAADLAVVRQDVSGQAIGWLDPQVGEAMRAMLIQRDHPLRPFWPEGDRLPRPLRERMDAAGPAVRNTLLATMYAADLAWCRLGGGIPARPRGFPASVAILAEIIGPRRATSAAPAEPVSQAPGIAALAHQYPPNPSIPDRTPGVPMAQRPPAGPPGQAPSWAPPAASSRSPATQAWSGAQPWPNPAEHEPAKPAPEAPAGSGEHEASQAGEIVPPTPAWPGTAGTETGRPAPPPPTGAWSATGEGAAGTPPPTRAWPGTADDAATPPPGTGTEGADRNERPPATKAWAGTGEGAAVAPPGTVGRGSGESGGVREARPTFPASRAGSDAEGHHGGDAAASPPVSREPSDVPGPAVSAPDRRSEQGPEGTPPDSPSRLAVEGTPTGTASGPRGPDAEDAASDAGAPVPGAEGRPGDGGHRAGGTSGAESAGPATAAVSATEAAPMPPSAAPAGSDAAGESVEMPADATGGDGADPSALRDAAAGEGPTGGSASGLPDDDDLTAPDAGGADTPADDEGDDTQPDEGAGVFGNVTMMDSFDEHVTGPTMLDPIGEPKNSTYVDWIGGTRADVGSIPIVAPAPVTPGPPRTRVIDEQEPPPPPGERSGARVMSGTVVGDLLHGAPMPDRPVDQIAPPPAPVSMPKVTERFGVRFLSERDDATELFDELHRTASRSGRPPALLIVGDPHAGQRRLTRLVARTFAGAGVGDGSVRTADGADLHGDHVTAVTAILRGSGPPLLFERLDRAVLDASDPDRVVAAVMGGRENKAALIATCEPDSYARLGERFPELIAAFQVFRLPDLAGVQARLALLHVLADERRVTITASGLDVVRGDLTRLGGHGDLVGARLVEGYLERAVARHVERAGAPRDRMVLVPVDFAGVAEEIEPALRPPRDVDGYLRGLEEMIGLDEVKRTVGGLVAEARMAADRAARGLPSGNPSRHLIFLGRPGTGKATVAGLIGGIYAALNLLDTGQLVVCGAKDLTGSETAAYVERAGGGVLLIEDAALLDRMPAAVDELARLMAKRRDKFMVICAGPPDEMEGFLLAHPGFRAEFGAIIEFREPTERQLVQLFSRLAERDLYMLDEELRVELLDRFAGMRRYPGFAFADTVRRLFDQIIARQAARLSGAQVNPAAVARLSVRDLPESEAGELLEELHPTLRRSPE